MGTAFLGAEAMILLGMGEDEMPNRAALRKIGALIRAVEERDQQRQSAADGEAGDRDASEHT